jgi:deferrochelatase/peroxidase EfeB
MVGRWKNGDSLVRYPHGPDGRSEPDNDFLFGVEDPDGMRCPFGAHIRRANARDTLAPGSEIQLRITNRHRILRVGRSYLPQEDLTKPGLIFMCLNSDIERQFEFVQQSWILGRSFGGLENEVDPMLGRGAAQHVLTIPTPNGPLRLKRMKDFVRVRGSGYFFLPGRRAMHFLARCPSEEAP